MSELILKRDDTFDTFHVKMHEHVDEMLESANALFVVDTDSDRLWELYLKSFPDGSNPVFRTRTEHDCSSCRHFVKAFGNVVMIHNNVITTIWDFGNDVTGTRYESVVNSLARYVRSCKVVDTFVADVAAIGSKPNHEMLDSGEILTWKHLNVSLPKKFLNNTGKTNDTARGIARDIRTVFKRSLDEISRDSILSVLELISSNSLYKGEEWKTVLEEFARHQRVYSMLSSENQEIYTWEQSVIAGPVIGKIRNHSIGTLLVDISKGMDLDEAVRRYESIVAPTNYKRPKAIFTKKMLEDAEKTLTKLGYIDSLGRRHAKLDDITINNILFANRDAVKSVIGGNIFTEMAKEVAVKPKDFDRVEEVSISKFVSDILPTVRRVEVLLENRHQPNMVSLIAPVNKDAPSMFKWNNLFSWAYAGNITDSMKQRVKEFGGDVSGVLRFSIQWGPGNDNDFDAHAIEPSGNEIYFRTKGQRHRSSGMLDVDIVIPRTQTTDGIAVENITYSDLSKMPEGTYKFFVHNFSHNGGRTGFTAEVEFDGKVHSFAYNKELRRGENVYVAEVTYSRANGFSIVEKIPSSLSSRKIWNLDSNQFHPVSVVMYSPNYWDSQDGIGNRHYFFMLKDCLNPEQPNGFFNEYLKNELMDHKRVFEALGSKMRVESSDEQLSGVGFSSTQRNSLTVKVEGHVNRILKIVF